MVLQLEHQPILIQAVFSGNVEDVRTALDYKQDANHLDSEKRSALHAAAYKGDVAIAELLISRGARVNAKDSRWITPLHRACCCGSAELVALLLQNKAETTVRDRQWQTPLHVAAANNSFDCVKLLLDQVPNVNVTDRMGRTALHHAALNGHTEVVELLLSKGCIVNACDKRDCRPIHCAAHMGHIETIETLLHYRADINAKDRHLYTPLHVAAASGMADACRVLLNYGAQVEVRNSYGNTPLYISCLNGHLPVCQILVKFNAELEAKNYRGQTPLHIAAASTHGVDCMTYLIDQGVNINRQSIDGRTPLHMTAIHGRFTRSKALIDSGAAIDCVDKNNCTALHIAALYGHDLLSNTLLSHGADASKQGYLGRTPLHMSCLSGHVECCRKFLQAGVDLDARDESGKTPIHCAAYKGSVECLDLLTSNGADFNILDNIGRLPLHYAAVQGHYSCVFTLVGLKSSVNLCDSEGCSPLHLAAAYDLKGHCVNYLLQHKADAKLKDHKGFTPIHYAVRGGNCEGLRYLLATVGNNYIMYGPEMPLTTPLHLAAHSGNQCILELLLRYFLDINIRTEQGSTALLLAARGGHTYCVQMLLRFGAKVCLADYNQQMTPIHYSAKNGHMHCLALLLDNAEDKSVIDAFDSLQRTALMLSVAHGHTNCALTLLKCGANPNIVDSDKHSSLFWAVGNGHQTAVELLISNGVNVNISDRHGKSVLHLAASCGRLHSLQMLLKHMSPEAIISLDNQRCSALHWACYSGNPACVSHLLEQGVFKELTGNPFSPVHCATFLGTERCLEQLRFYFGLSIIKLKDARNRTPLHISSLHGHIDCAKYLLEQGAEINCQDLDGRTPLIAAAQNGQSQIIDILISYKADMTLYDNNGNTALHLACLKRHNHAALLLLEHIDDVDIVNMINNDRKTPLHLSARNGLVDVTRELIGKGSSVLAVDSNGMTPALCCAPNSNVARCLAIILANYAVCSQKSDNKDSASASLIHFFQIKSLPAHSVKLKTYRTRVSQTNITLIHNPDFFECRRIFGFNISNSDDESSRTFRLQKLHHASQTLGCHGNPAFQNVDIERWLRENARRATTTRKGSNGRGKGSSTGGSSHSLQQSYDLALLREILMNDSRMPPRQKNNRNGSMNVSLREPRRGSSHNMLSSSASTSSSRRTQKCNTQYGDGVYVSLPSTSSSAVVMPPHKLRALQSALSLIKVERATGARLERERLAARVDLHNRRVAAGMTRSYNQEESRRTNEQDTKVERESKNNTENNSIVVALSENVLAPLSLEQKNHLEDKEDKALTEDREVTMKIYELRKKSNSKEVERLRRIHEKIVSDKLSTWKDTECETEVNSVIVGLEALMLSDNLKCVAKHVGIFESTLSNWPESLPEAVEIIDHIVAVVKETQWLKKMQTKMSHLIDDVEEEDDDESVNDENEKTKEQEDSSAICENINVGNMTENVEKKIDEESSATESQLKNDEKNTKQKIASYKFTVFHVDPVAYFCPSNVEMTTTTNLPEPLVQKPSDIIDTEIINGTISLVSYAHMQKEVEKNLDKADRVLRHDDKQQNSSNDICEKKTTCNSNNVRSSSNNKSNDLVSDVKFSSSVQELKDEGCNNVKKTKTKKSTPRYACTVS